MTTRLRLDYLDGLRGIAALWVLANHATDTLWLGESRHNICVFLVHSIAQYAHLAVTLFILLSGFCLMLPVAGEGHSLSAGAFFQRRCRRILPPYFAALLLSLPVSVHFAHPNHNALLRDMVGHVLLMQDVFIPGYVWGEYNLNAPLWSIAVEWHIYLFFPILVLLWKQAGALRTLFYAAACAGLLWYAQHDGPQSGMWLLYYAFFCPRHDDRRHRFRPLCGRITDADSSLLSFLAARLFSFYACSGMARLGALSTMDGTAGHSLCLYCSRFAAAWQPCKGKDLDASDPSWGVLL